MNKMNKGIKYLIVGLMAVATALSSYAANIQVTAQAQSFTYMALENGTYVPLASGDRIEIGTFASTPTDGSPSLAGWTVFGAGTYNLDGGFQFQINTDEAGFAHNQIYMAFYNNATGVVTPGVTQLGIFYVNDATNTDWRFPASTDAFSDTLVEMENLVDNPSLAGSTLKTGAHLVFGNLGHDLVTVGGPYTFLQLATVEPVPEPSTVALVGCGLVGAIGLIRRRRS